MSGGGRALVGLSLVGLASFGCVADDGVPPTRLAVRDGFLRDADGRAVILRGVNLSGEHKRTSRFAWHRAEDFRRVRTDWGLNAVRLLVAWAAVEPERGRIDRDYLERLAERVRWAEEAGLLVVLDLHQDVWGEGFPEGNGAPRWTCPEENYARHKVPELWLLAYATPEVTGCFDGFWRDGALQERYAEAWAAVARRLAGSRAVVGFDVMNEPHWGSHPVWSFEAARLQPFYERVSARVQAEAPHWLPFLEPAASRNMGLPTGLRPIAGRPFVYAPHSYDATAEQGLGFSEERRQAVVDHVAALAADARALGAPLWLGEYGGVAGHPGIAAYLDAEYAAAGAVAAGTMVWHYGKDAGYGLLDETGREKPELLASLVRPYPSRVAGRPRRYGFEPGARRFEVVFDPDPESAAPTELVVPPRVYRAGYRVLCDGCVHEVDGDTLRIGQAPTSRPARVVLEPRQ
ncbi:MAG: cellulase family glycosylhydrolase [Deltaproteobacteria bacterium]|nr:cellulase family glycosylhydrolase [Deltaproteobacteria bacterium]